MNGLSMRTWVYFLACTKETMLRQLTTGFTGHLNFYRIKEINPVRGEVPADLARCLNVVRIEASMPLEKESLFPASTPIIQFQGVTQHLQYTSDAQQQELNRCFIPELEPSDHTTAVLIPIGKSEEWWKLAHDRRQAHFQKTDGSEGHTEIGLKYVDRIFRKLYHSRYLNPVPSYDFLTYFEFGDVYEKDFRSLLAELRDTKEWTFVNLEFELWMTKRG